jgi:hypothetical protein
MVELSPAAAAECWCLGPAARRGIGFPALPGLTISNLSPPATRRGLDELDADRIAKPERLAAALADQRAAGFVIDEILRSQA